MIGKIAAIEAGEAEHVVVSTDGGEVAVGLAEDVVIQRGFDAVGRNALHPGQNVVMSGSFVAGRGTATRVDLVERLSGTVDEIMEVYPLRLSVNTSEGSQYVQLEEDTFVYFAGEPMDSGKLTTGMTVMVFGFGSGNMFVARGIQVESTGP